MDITVCLKNIGLLLDDLLISSREMRVDLHEIHEDLEAMTSKTEAVKDQIKSMRQDLYLDDMVEILYISEDQKLDIIDCCNTTNWPIILEFKPKMSKKIINFIV
jgi:hypothetical protein